MKVMGRIHKQILLIFIDDDKDDDKCDEEEDDEEDDGGEDYEGAVVVLPYGSPLARGQAQ